VYCFWVGKAVVQVPGSGDLYEMVMLGFIGDCSTLEYVTKGENWATEDPTRLRAHVKTIGDSWKNYQGVSMMRTAKSAPSQANAKLTHHDECSAAGDYGMSMRIERFKAGGERTGRAAGQMPSICADKQLPAQVAAADEVVGVGVESWGRANVER